MTGAISRPVVTLFETYGSGATVIGPAVAEALGVRFIGQAYSSEDIEGAEESHSQQDSLLARVLGTLGRTVASADGGIFSGSVLTRDAVENIRAVREFVADGGVILGRNATVILDDIRTALHVKLDGPLEQRLARGAAEADIDLAHARARQVREDRVRAELSLRLHNWDPRSNDRFDLVVNTGTLPTHLAVQVIVAAYRMKTAEAV